MKKKLLKFAMEKNLVHSKNLARILLLDELPIGVGAEIGVFKGYFSNHLLGKATYLYLIDPWEKQDLNSNRGFYENQSQEDFNANYELVKERFKDFSNVKIIREYSDKAVKHIKHKLDWVYIDGDHTYSGVTKDLTKYYPLLKSGGILCGDDFTSEFKGLKQAVYDTL